MGRHVSDASGKAGVVVGRGSSSNICKVKLDLNGEEHYYIFWMLHAAGGSAETNDKLVPGKYECFAGGHYTFMDMHVTGANSYESAGTHGTFRIEPSRKIVFLSGSLKPYHAHLLPGPTIGLNTNGSSFWSTTCELKKS
ncbi:MAG: hypothetical protein GIW95_00750 [Candidatus Eremiobacteraeota bacterium]|nr:hypothetical protein [Candidatus Eremiobacteraeota bacterium]